MRLRSARTARLAGTVASVAVVASLLLSRDAAAGLTPDDPRYPEQWSLRQIRADEAWLFGQGSTAVKVALLDTGIGYGSVPADLAVNVAAGYDTFTGGTTTYDDYGTYGSGTSNAGVIGARGNNARDISGTAWNITIYPVKVCDWNGQCPHSNIAAGIAWALARDVDIIQITPAQSANSGALEQAVASAVNAGVLVVAPVAEPATGIGYPAALPGVITVGATTSTDSVAVFSASGPQLDIVAPGQGVLVLASGGCCISRSANAIAAAHVTGALALLLSEGVAPAVARQSIYDGARDLGANGWDATSGWGRLDVCGALAEANGSCMAACPDFDNNGWSDLADVQVTLQHYGATGTGLPWDLDGDGGVALGDAMQLLNCIF